MSEISFVFARSFIDASPFILAMAIAIAILRGPVVKFISRNLLDSGKDRYNAETKDNNTKKNGNTESQPMADEKIKFHIRKILLNESGQKYFDAYRENVESLIEKRQKELANYALTSVFSENKIEEAITESLHDTVEDTTKKLIRESEQFKILEKETIEKLNLIKISSFLEHLEKEYDATRSTKALMSNMFILVNVFYFFWPAGFSYIWAKHNNHTVYLFSIIVFLYWVRCVCCLHDKVL